MKYPVQPGDTPASFAARYNLTLKRLKSLNDSDDRARVELERASLLTTNDRELRGVSEFQIGGKPQRIGQGWTLDDVFANYKVDERTLRLENPQHVQEIARAAAAVDGRSISGIRELEVGGIAVAVSNPVIDEKLVKTHADDVQELLDLNDARADEIRNCFGEKVALRKRLKNVEFLVVVRTAAPVADAGGPPVEPNPDFDWLLWEARANAADFQKRKAALAYGLFAVPLDHRAEIVASRELPEILAKAFFPGMSVAEVQEMSEQSCRWRGGAERTGGPGPNSVGEQVVARTEAIIHAPRMMVLPYNYFANDGASYAIGTMLENDVLPGPAFRLKKFWPMWETASRSSVSLLEETTEEDLAKAKRLGEQWKFRSETPPAGAAMPAAYKDKIFKLEAARDNCYSVKTGVRWIGKKAQGSNEGLGKDVLETNALLASMRSDWIEHVENTVGTAPNLIVLRELLTVTFQNWSRHKRDGYQIRDLRPLDRSKIYFPPLSIPFGGRAFVEAYNERHKDKPLDFETFWRENYARAVGKAKAELLLRYGLQLTTPNPQNFLLEFDKKTLEPTGRVVIRDIGDAKIHSEVIQTIGLGQPVIDYELNAPDRPGYLPAQTNNQGRKDDHARHDRFDQYPLNTRTHWHQYSTFKNQYGGSFLPSKMMTTIGWGRAHYAAYVEHLAERLKHPALRIDIFGQAAYESVMRATEPEPNTSKGTAAQKVLAAALAVTKNSVTAITPATYDQLIRDRKCVESEVVLTEWALEVHSDEVLHQLLASPEVLGKVKGQWVKS